MASSYKRDKNGRFASAGGGGAKPKAGSAVAAAAKDSAKRAASRLKTLDKQDSKISKAITSAKKAGDQKSLSRLAGMLADNRKMRARIKAGGRS
jgi:hypothetical protein